MKRPRISYANVVSSLALFIALGGVSYAAIKIPANSVGSSQIKPSAVSSSDIKNGQVKEADVGSGAVSAKKLKSGAVGRAAIASGAVGSSQIADGSVSGSELADGSASSSKLADNAVNSSKVADGALGSGDLADNAVTGAKIADGGVSSSDIADGTIIAGDLSSDLVQRSVAAYASIDGAGPSINQPYSKNVISVTRMAGQPTGRYCLNVDWAAAGRSPAQQATPVIVTSRDIGKQAAGDVYNPSCPDNGVYIALNTSATNLLPAVASDGWVHVLIP